MADILPGRSGWNGGIAAANLVIFVDVVMYINIYGHCASTREAAVFSGHLNHSCAGGMDRHQTILIRSSYSRVGRAPCHSLVTALAGSTFAVSWTVKLPELVYSRALV